MAKLPGMDSCFRRNDGGGWLGDGVMYEGANCLGWIPGFVGIQEARYGSSSFTSISPSGGFYASTNSMRFR